MNYSFLPAMSKATLEDYEKLFHDCFQGNTKLNIDYLKWQYVNNPHGKVIGVDAFLGDELAAHYSIIPRKYVSGTTVFNAALSVNTATSPKHQGKGLFKNLAKSTYEQAEAAGVQFVFGVANANSIGGFVRRLEFTDLGSVGLYLQSKAQVFETASLSLKVDQEWLNWRLSNPSRTYKLIAHGNGASARSKIDKYNFNIAWLGSDINIEPLLAIDGVEKGSSVLPVFTPVFGVKKNKLFKLPARFQPSPWRVIARAFDTNIDQEIFDKLVFDGMAMDTF